MWTGPWEGPLQSLDSAGSTVFQSVGSTPPTGSSSPESLTGRFGESEFHSFEDVPLTPRGTEGAFPLPREGQRVRPPNDTGTPTKMDGIKTQTHPPFELFPLTLGIWGTEHPGRDPTKMGL